MIFTKKPIHYSWWILAGCCLFNLAVLGIVNSCQGIFLIPVTESLGISSSQFSLLITIQGLIGVISMPIAGRIIPKYSLKIVLGTAFLVYMGSFIGISFTRSLPSFLSLGVTLGAAGGFLMYIPVAVLLGNWFNEKYGFVMGIAMAFSGIGGTVFNPLGNFFIQEWGWQNAYRLLGLIGIVLALPVILFVFKRHPQDCGMTPYGKETETDNVSDGTGSLHPFKSRAFFFVLLWSLSIGVLGGIMYHIPAYAGDLSYSPYIGSSLLSMFMLSMTIGKIALGYINDRLGAFFAIRIYLVMALAGVAGMVFTGKHLILLFVSAALLGQGMALMLVETPILVRKVFGNKDYSSIYSVISMIANVTAMVSVSLYGLLRDFSGAYTLGFVITIIFPCTAWLGAYFSLKSKNREEL